MLENNLLFKNGVFIFKKLFVFVKFSSVETYETYLMRKILKGVFRDPACTEYFINAS